MSVFMTSITELSQNFFNSNPLKFNEYFAITPDYQKYGSNTRLPTRITVTLAKEAMLIHDIAIHLLIGGVKLTTGAVKGICAIASGILGMETDHQTPSKQGAVHIGFACVYAADIFISITNINKTYPQHLIDKIEIFFTNFLETSNKNIVTKNIIVPDPAIEQELETALKEIEERDADLHQLEQEVEETVQKLRKPSQCEKIVDEALHSNTNTILGKVRSGTENNQKQKLEDFPLVKRKTTNWFEDDDGFWSEEVLSSSDTFDNELDLILFGEKKDLLRDVPKIGSTSQISKSSRKALSNNPLQKSAFSRRQEYSQRIRKLPPKKLIS